MENILDFAKKNKKMLIVIGVVLVFFLAIFIALKKVVNYLSPSSKASVYGERCEAVKDIPVTNDDKKAIETVVKAYPNMELKSIDVKCKLIDITVNLKEDVADEVIVEMSNSILDALKDKNINKNKESYDSYIKSDSLKTDIYLNYDIELILTNSNKENDTYPRIGTHHKLIVKKENGVLNYIINDSFVW